MTDSFRTRSPRVDVVLPCLDEAAALPWVLARIPAGWRAIVVDNGSTDGSADLARALGATVVHEPRRGFGAACHAGLLAADGRHRLLLRLRRLPRPRRCCPASCAGSPTGTPICVLGRRRPEGRGAWPLHARAGNLALARMLRRRTGLRLHDLGPMRAARRDGPARPGPHRPAQRLPAADGGARRRRRAGGSRRRTSRTCPRTGRSKVTGTWRGTWQAVRDMRAVLREPPHRTAAARPYGRRRPDERGTGPRAACPGTTLLVIAKEPRARPRQDPADPALHPRRGRAARRGRARRHPAHRAARCRPGGGSWCSTGGPAPGCRPASRSSPQCAGGLDERLAAAFGGCTGPALLIGMDTPQITAAHAGARALPGRLGRLRRVVRAGRGRRLLGARPGRARPGPGARRADVHPGRPAPSSGGGSPTRGCACAICRRCGTWTPRPTPRGSRPPHRTAGSPRPSPG